PTSHQRAGAGIGAERRMESTPRKKTLKLGCWRASGRLPSRPRFSGAAAGKLIRDFPGWDGVRGQAIAAIGALAVFLSGSLGFHERPDDPLGSVSRTQCASAILGKGTPHHQKVEFPRVPSKWEPATHVDVVRLPSGALSGSLIE